MLISVIIPMYNSEKTILKTLESVKNQTIDTECFEIIIINDGSSDNSEFLVKKFIAENTDLNITLINQPNKGVSAARNAGLKMAKGEYIALLDSDDEWLPEKTEKQIKFLNQEVENIDFISCNINSQKIFFPYVVKNQIAKVTFKKLLIRNGIPVPSVIFKSKILQKVGYFDENQNFAEDHHYWLNVSLNFSMYILNENLVIAGNGKRTFGVSGLSGNLFEMEKGFIYNLKSMLSQKKINFIEFIFYRIFYKAKFFLLIFRNQCYSIFKKE